MTIRELLTGTGVDRIDAEMLVGLVLQKSRSWILAHDDEPVSSDQKERIDALIARRKFGEPLSYITGTKEFYGRDFIVTPDVLIPRPATESLIRIALEFLKGGTPLTQEIDAEISAHVERLSSKEMETIIDAGTGSGCIAITLALEGVTQEVIGVDTSKAALAIAERNKKNLNAKNASFIHSDGPTFVHGFRKPFLLISNPPYIPSGITLEKSVKNFEPHKALFAGDDGLAVIRPLLAAARKNPACVAIILELRSDQIPNPLTDRNI